MTALFEMIWLFCKDFRILLLSDLLLHGVSYLWLLGKNSWNRLLFQYFFQKGIQISLGGVLYLGGQTCENAGELIGKMLVTGGVICVFLKSVLRRKIQVNAIYQAELLCLGKSCRVSAYLDTGNQLYYGAKPVIVLSPEVAEKLELSKESIWETMPERFCLIPYSSVGCQGGVLRGFRCDRLALPEEKRVWEQIVVAIAEYPLSGKDEFQLLLHPALFRDSENKMMYRNGE